MTISRTLAALALPPVAFITAPTIAPAAWTFPPRIFSATSGFAESASSTAATRAPSSLTTSSPRAETTSDGVPSPARTPSSTCRASLSVSLPSRTRPSSSAMSEGVTGASRSSTSASLACRAMSPIHHLRAPEGLAPAATVASTRSTASALTRSRSSSSESSHSTFTRRRLAAGSSGMPALSSSTHAGSGATGTRSGSGKYR